MRPTLYEFAGGEAALLRLAEAHHRRCVEDPELNHPFSHDDLNPEHVSRLAWYWGEVLGGPPRYTETCGETQTALLQMHAGNGDMTDLGRRFERCFAEAMDEVRLPEDPAFRGAMNGYMHWAVEDVLLHGAPGTRVPPQTMPRWGWDGLEGA